jgi:hypothetical protein
MVAAHAVGSSGIAHIGATMDAVPDKAIPKTIPSAALWTEAQEQKNREIMRINARMEFPGYGVIS